MVSAKTVVNVAAVISNLAAAGLWWWSARVATAPKEFPMAVVRPDQMWMPLGQPLGGTYVGHGYSPQLDEYGAALNRQSKLSAWAAICTGLGAAASALAMGMGE